MTFGCYTSSGCGGSGVWANGRIGGLEGTRPLHSACSMTGDSRAWDEQQPHAGCYNALPKLLLASGEVPADESIASRVRRPSTDSQGNGGPSGVIFPPVNEKDGTSPPPIAQEGGRTSGETRNPARQEKVRFVAEHGLRELQPKEIRTRLASPRTKTPTSWRRGCPGDGGRPNE